MYEKFRFYMIQTKIFHPEQFVHCHDALYSMFVIFYIYINKILLESRRPQEYVFNSERCSGLLSESDLLKPVKMM